jgi:hypothetical protein
MIMTKNFFRLFSLVCITALFCNCHKQKGLPVLDMDNDSTVHALFNFQKGSYWIYRDSLNGRIDSFFVSSNYYEKQAEQYNIINYHYITITDYNIDGTKPADSSDWILNFQGDLITADYHYGRNGYGWKSDINYNPFFIFPFQQGNLNSAFDTALVTGIYPVDSSNSLPFLNVAVIHQYVTIDTIAGLGYTTINDLFYINDSVGMIKMSIYHPLDSINHVWKLQRYNVVK